MDIGSTQFWMAALQIIMINIVLSGDNAVVIALACRNLPADLRRRGILWGVTGAVILRIALTSFAVTMLDQPYLKLIGGLLLLWIGVKLLTSDEEHDENKINASDNFWGAVKTIVVADLVMSIDNVVGVAAAARGNFGLLVFGLAVSIPLIVGSSQLIMKAMDRFPLIVTFGAGLLGWVAGEMIVSEKVLSPWLERYLPHADKLLAPAGAVFVVALGRMVARMQRSTRPQRPAVHAKKI